ncbi:MAG: hypothetical protein HUU35_18950 [Armatimonadetes bacterium]|nr:hypothetical protein [Armatimonadota bacterium]
MVRTHPVQVFAVANFVLGLRYLLAAPKALLWLRSAAPALPRGDIARWLLLTVSLAPLVGLLLLLSGIGLWRQRSWGRVLAIAGGLGLMLLALLNAGLRLWPLLGEDLLEGLAEGHQEAWYGAVFLVVYTLFSAGLVAYGVVLVSAMRRAWPAAVATEARELPLT